MSKESKQAARIIVVDDEPDIANTLGRGLEQLGFETVSYSRAVDALTAVSNHPDKCSAVVTDIKMPNMNGFELARELRIVNPNIKVIFITAFEIRPEEFAKTMPSTKVDGFIRKPVRLEELKKMLQSLGVSAKHAANKTDHVLRQPE